MDIQQSTIERQSAIEKKIGQLEQQLELTCEALESLAKQIQQIREALSAPKTSGFPGPFF
jgi:prefoldin subunit 5